MPAAPVASDAGSSRPNFESPQSAYYTGQSESYSSFVSPADQNARLNLLHVESQRASFDASMAEQSSIYTPEAASKGGYKDHKGKGKGRKTVLRKGGGELWEDASLMEWDPTHFRLFVGDLDPALSDDLFKATFANIRYPSFVKAKVIRDKYTNKGKGFGFVSYSDPQDFLKAWKEVDGTYVGTRPVRIKKATTGVAAVEIGNKKAAVLDKKSRGKSGTISFEKANEAIQNSGNAPGQGSSGNSGGFGPDKNRKSYIRR